MKFWLVAGPQCPCHVFICIAPIFRAAEISSADSGRLKCVVKRELSSWLVLLKLLSADLVLPQEIPILLHVRVYMYAVETTCEFEQRPKIAHCTGALRQGQQNYGELEAD